MKLTAYLSPSRHGIYYFRWPLPRFGNQPRSTIRISLHTRCPEKAGDLARHLASYGCILRKNQALQRLRNDEIRILVRAHFQKVLSQYLETLNNTGFEKRSLDLLKSEMEVHEEAIDGFHDISDSFLDAMGYQASIGVSDALWRENEPALRQEIRKARRDQIKQVLDHVDQLDGYDFQTSPAPAITTTATPSMLLGKAVQDFMAEHRQAGNWTPKTANKMQSYLDVLTEFFGPNREMVTITKQDAQEIKKVVLALPARRNTLPQTRDLPLKEAIGVQGLPKISTKTINSYIGSFLQFYGWAENNGYAPTKLFEGMKVSKAKTSLTVRKTFSPDAMTKMYAELTENTTGLVKKESHKWGTLIAMFTGARLNEICQLYVADIQQQDGIWYFNITDEGDNNKRVKADASRRKVPIHSELLRLGLLEYRASCTGTRLFDFSYNKNEGYGRPLGRWFNTRFAPTLGVKTPSHVFHSFRHTLVTRLAQAGVDTPLVQSIVGHEREGVTQQVYLKDGYTLAQLKEAIEMFEVRN